MTNIKHATKNSLCGLMGLIVASGAWGVTTAGYVRVSEVKAFDDRVLAYLEDAQEHQCSSTHEKTAYRLDPAKKHMVVALLTAYGQQGIVSLSYDCGSDGLPYISGIRIRP
jgi:hypothetical protein